MDGVTSMTREFSTDFSTMRNEYKYTVEYFEDGVEITYLQKTDGKWNKHSSFHVDPTVAEILFRTVAKDFDEGNANIGY